MSGKNHTKEHSSSGCEVEGILCNVGTDFIDVLQDNHTVVTILRNNINKIIWPEKHCNPCTCGEHDCEHCCDCHHHDHHPNHHHHDDCGCHHTDHHDRLPHVDCGCSCGCDCHHVDITHCHYSPYIPVCHGRVQLRLGRLTDSLNFHLFSQKGCRIIVTCSSH